MSFAVIRVSEVYLQQGVSTPVVEWLASNSILNVDEDNLAADCDPDGWHLSNRIEEREDFATRTEAQKALDHFGDEYLAIIPIAERPLSPAAIKSAEWLVNQLVAA